LVSAKIGEVKEETRHKKGMSAINVRVNRFNRNVVTIGEPIMKAQNGDKEHSHRLLSGLSEACRESGGC